MEFEIVGLKGTPRWLETHCVPLRNPRHEVVAALSVTRDITERKRAEADLRGSRAQLRALMTKFEAVREQERARIAQEVHDELGQILTALNMDLTWLDQRLAGLNGAAVTPLRERLGEMLPMLDSCLEAVQRIITELRPRVLDELGLVAAVEWQLQQFQKRTGAGCAVTADLDDGALDAEVSTALFRIFQEALTNIARHAGAARVCVRLAEEQGSIILEVKDDGRGITPGELTNPRSLGLAGMRERAGLLGGEVRISAAEKQGTTVLVRLPLRRCVEA
jgi:signal transduction histidine kinase